jgi:two-component system, OmpR family, sensor histidine kinase ChvG
MSGRRTLLGRVGLSRIGLRLLAFNLLVVFLPVVGILYLDVYETELLVAQERGMVQQARTLAAALGGRDLLSASDATDLLNRIVPRSDVRLRVYDGGGTLIADSTRLQATSEPEASSYDRSESRVRDRIVYRVGAWLANTRRAVSSRVRAALRRSPIEPVSAGDERPGSEIRAALDGRYGTAVRMTAGQRSLTLHSAVPIRSDTQVIGVAVASQSTWRILQALYMVRLRIFAAVLASLAAAAILSVLVSARFVRPLVRLQRAALAHGDRRRPRPAFPGLSRRDEIGDLARALEDLTRRLDAHIGLAEAFAADVSHEFRNPLASIRTAAEMMTAADTPEERQRFFGMLARDADRLERLVAGVRELARIDAQVQQDDTVQVGLRETVEQIVEGFKLAGYETIFTISGDRQAMPVRVSPNRLVQAIENVLHNARTFAPRGSEVEVRLRGDGDRCRMAVCDRGPGIPEAHLAKVFDRFFSYRPGDAVEARLHTGLGLSITRAIIEGYGGTVSASHREGGGACIEIVLPIASPLTSRAIPAAWSSKR